MDINLLKYISIYGYTESRQWVKFGMNFEEVLYITKTASGQCPNAVFLVL